MQTEEKNILKASKLTSFVVCLMLVTVVFSAILIPNVAPTTVTNNGAPAAFVKQSQNNVLVMNFTITTSSDTKLAGKTPTAGTILEASGQANDWGNSSVGTAIILSYNPVGPGEYNWRTDCIWQENASNPNTNYNSIDTIINGTAPAENTPNSWYGCRAPTWTKIKTYDAVAGGLWDSTADAIINESGDNNNCWLDQLSAVTVNLSSACNATNSDISTVSLWVDSGTHPGFLSTEDTRLKTVTSGTSWNLSGITQAINLSATFYVTVNISGSASHQKTIKMQIPTLYDANSNGAYNAGDRGLFLASTNDNGNYLNTNFLTIDSYAPITSANTISGYWKKLSSNPVTMTGTATDNCSGLASVALYYRYSSDNSSWGSPVIFGTDSTPWPSNGVSYSFTFSNGSGYYGFYTRGTDNVSNVESALTSNDTICGYDITNPSSTINRPSNNGYNNSVTNISGTASDTYSGVSTVTITVYNSTNHKYFDGTTWGTSATNLAATVHSALWYRTAFPTWTTGTTYMVNSTATDRAGNSEAVAHSHTFLYDANNPTAAITTPADLTWYNAMTNITGTAADTGGSGLSLVNITIYNATVGTGHKYWNGTTWSAVVVNFTATGTASWYKASGLPTWTNASTYYINATAKDNAGNVGTKHSHTMYFDNFKPRSSVTAISPYWKTTVGNLAISYTTITDAGSGLYNVTLYYRYSTDNGSWGGWVARNVDSDPWITQSWSFNLANGSGFYEFYSRARDNATNFENAPGSADTRAGYDVVNPTATIGIPVNGGYYRTGSAIDTNITGTASDAEGILTVNLTIYNSTGHKYWNTSQARWVAYAIGVGNITVNLTGSGATRGWYFSNPHLYPTWLTSNVYVINASAKDGAGNWELAADSNSFTYDTNNPSTTITIPVDAHWYRTLTNVSGTAADTGGSGLNLVNITLYNSTSKKYWNGTTWSAVVVNFTATGTSTWYKNSGLPSVWANGSTYIINATAKDNAGNVGAKHSHTFYMDLATPGSQVTAISGYWKTSTPQTISYTANNSGSGLYYVKLYYRYATDNSTWGGWTSNNNDTDPWITKQWSFAFTNGSGYYQVYSRAADNVSNLEAAPGVKDAYCGYDASNPTVTITVPVNGSHYNTMSTISGTCADTGYSGINSVNLTIYNTTAHKYWNGTSHAWESGVRWVSSAIAAGYLSWSYNSNLVTWQDHLTYWVNATSKDNATRTSSAHWHFFTYDTTSPTCSISYNISRNYYQDADSVKIFANFTTPVGLNEGTVRINLTYADATYTNTTLTRVNNTRWYYNWNVPAGAAKDGIVTVSIFAQDNATNYLNPYPTTSTTKRIDNTAPTSQVSGIAGYWKTSSPLTISATASDTGSGLARVTLYYYYSAGNASFAGPTSFGTNTSPWVGVQWSFNFPAGDGFYRFYSRATDNVSLTESAPISNDTQCGYDHTAPTSSTDAIHPYWKISSPVTITATASDATSQVKNITLYYRFSSDNSTWGATWLPVGKDSASPWSWDVTLVNNSGYYQFYTRANDTATNREAAPGAADASAGYDHTAPSCTIAYNTTRTYFKEGMKLKVFANFTESGSGIAPASVQIAITTAGNGGLAATGMTQTNNTRWYYGWTIPAGSDDDGTVTVNIYATDNATNNLATYPTTSAIKKIDNTVPTCTITYNNARTYFKSGESLRIYANFTGGNPSGLDENGIRIWIDTQGNGGVDNTTLSRTNNTKWYYDWTIPAGSDDDGVVTINIKALDNATNNLNPYPTQSATKRIDNTRPTATIAFNNARTYYTYADTVRIYANFTEAGSGIDLASVIINISTLGNGDTANTTMTETNGLHWYYDWNVPSGSDEDGTVTIKFYVKDNATNLLNPWSTNNSAKKIDNTAPTCTIAYNNTYTYYKAGAALKIYANFTEAGSGIAESSIHISIVTAGNGALANTTMSRTDNTHWYYSWTIPSGSDDDGTATVKIWATDNATYPLNPYPTTNATKIIDNTAPALSYAVLDADNDGTNNTYIDVHFSETTMDTTTETYTDFNISKSGVGISSIQTKTDDLVTLKCNRTFQTGDSPHVGIVGSVADLAGNTLTSGYVTINTYRVYLRTGWNLLSVPADPHNTLISTVLSSITDNMAIIWSYNASSNTWSSWTPSDGDTLRLYPGHGYWINMPTADTLVGNYNLMPTGPTSPPYVTLSGQKWNLVGHWQAYNQTASTNAGGGLASLPDGYVGILYKYTGTGYTNILNGAQNMVPGQGYWMWTKTGDNNPYSPS